MPNADHLPALRKFPFRRRLFRIGIDPGTASRSTLFAVSLALFILVIIVVERSFGIYFESNDDVGMMMIAHGFGLAALPSAAIIYSNIVEGKIVEFIGEPFGLTGYGIYTTSCLVLALAYIHATIAQVTLRYFSSMVLILSFSVRAIFAPQFTVTAGILAAAAILALTAGTRQRSIADLIAFSSFAIASFCMRAGMFYFTIFLALPLFLSWPLKLDRRVLATVTAVAVLCILLTILDAQVYRAPAWRAFEAMNPVRALFTDFRLADRIPLDDARMASVGVTSLDIKLVSSRWFIGISANHLYQLLSLVGPGPMVSMSMGRVFDWLNLYAAPSINTVTFLTLLTFLAVPARQTLRPLLSLLILLAITFIVVAAGRPGFSRVVYPSLLLVGIVNILFSTRPRLLLAATCLILPFTATHFIESAKNQREVRDSAIASLALLRPAPVHVVWGGNLPFEALYPPLETRRDTSYLRFYALGVSQLAPFALAYWKGSEAGFIEQLTSPTGISIFALAPELGLLGAFCEQKLQGHLTVKDVVTTPHFQQQRVSCRVAPPQDAGQ